MIKDSNDVDISKIVHRDAPEEKNIKKHLTVVTSIELGLQQIMFETLRNILFDRSFDRVKLVFMKGGFKHWTISNATSHFLVVMKCRVRMETRQSFKAAKRV